MVEKKKRGRKPKNNIVQNENPVFDNKGDVNLIACLKKPKKKDGTISSGNIGGPEISDNLCYISDSKEIVSNQYNCWNCCHEICGPDIISYPIKYSRGIFHMNGNFCSYECTARYIFDNFNHKEIWEKYNLLNLYYSMNTNNKKKVNVPPSRLRLEFFGGDLSRLEYINKDKNNISYDGYLPPVIPINNIFYNNENMNVSGNNEFKLYRKKNLHDKDIKDKLNAEC
jgi:hypothetical protein|tara:strand:+ start:498 stop:1175 length:678 start_codon:yes stop_codon:yes gene_type:complete